MQIEDIKVGMKVKANKESDGIHTVTTQSNECVGEVTHVGATYVKVKITGHKLDHEIGQVYSVRPVALDRLEEGIKVNLKHPEVRLHLQVGDLAVLENGDCYLIGRRSDQHRAFNLKTSNYTEYFYSLDNLKGEIEQISGSKVVRTVPSSNIEITER